MRAGALVAATRDRDELLDQVACLVVPALADYCVVFLPTADGMLRASSLSHRNRARARVLAALREHPISPAGPLLPQRAYTTRTTQLSRDVDAEMTVLDPATGDLSYANAGHPPPLVTTGTGHAEYLDDTTGTMLGACTATSFTTGHRLLRPGARLLLYTDGLIEDRHRDISDSLAILAETLRRSRPSSAGQTCADVHAALLGTARRDDDVCLLTARLTPEHPSASQRQMEPRS